LDGELTLRGYGSADGFAPIPAVRGIAIESREATQLRHWPREFGASAT
jgi:hypothetical protein